ncbi:hypothetical protein WICMUC_004407 [Wickerhamomyces mucosus]|uniref:DNA damage-binding protein CMR1 n=1 Tax=Wickerhamomyces mucosus TaxID=1378264 RepID=A0A9P8PH13_9ASCO|nr:hypothetical protein WICMUC_004407 [Wickerhamomyces mucosus]
MTLSEFEKQRQANIERNKKLLNSLNLNNISGEISKSIFKVQKNQEQAKRVKKEKKLAKPKVEKVSIPTRRSRRLAGVSIDGDDEKRKLFDAEQERINREKAEFESLKKVRINGDLSLIDLVKEEGEGELSAEKIQLLLKNSKSFSVGDYYEMIAKKENSSKDVKELREEFSNKVLYDQWVPNQLKLTKERMSYITFHPSNTEKIVIGGDISGHFGIFNAGNQEDIDITNFKLHGNNISKIEFDMKDLTKVYTASYDGSIRLIDLEKFKSEQFFINSFDSGFSDIQIYDNSLTYVNKNGKFGRLDLRTGKPSHDVLRLSNKKIGGFTINPNNSNLVATGSLDRSLKVWDTRYIKKCDWTDWDDDLKTCANLLSYDSRLSVSNVDWNNSNDLVCNGYDDTVNIFNLTDSQLSYNSKLKEIPKLDPQKTIKHNCQTGRWCSILKARWQKFPRDTHEKFIIGNMTKAFDIYDNKGHQLAHLKDPLMTNVPAVCNLHPTENWICGGGASGKVYLFS